MSRRGRRGRRGDGAGAGDAGADYLDLFVGVGGTGGVLAHDVLLCFLYEMVIWKRRSSKGLEQQGR